MHALRGEVLIGPWNWFNPGEVGRGLALRQQQLMQRGEFHQHHQTHPCGQFTSIKELATSAGRHSSQTRFMLSAPSWNSPLHMCTFSMKNVAQQPPRPTPRKVCPLGRHRDRNKSSKGSFEESGPGSDQPGHNKTESISTFPAASTSVLKMSSNLNYCENSQRRQNGGIRTLFCQLAQQLRVGDHNILWSGLESKSQ